MPDDQARGAHSTSEKLPLHHTDKYHPHFPSPFDHNQPEGAKYIILESGEGTCFAVARKQFTAISTFPIVLDTVSVVHFPRADEESLALVLMTCLYPEILAYSDPIELVEGYLDALQVSRIYGFKGFPRAFLSLLSSLKSRVGHGDTAAEAQAHVEPSSFYTVAALGDDALNSDEYLRATVLKAVLESSQNPSSRGAASTGVRSPQTISTRHTNKDRSSTALASSDTSNIGFVPPEIVTILRKHKPHALQRLLDAYQTYYSLYDRFAYDLGVNVRIEGFGATCKRRFGRGCDAYLLSHKNFSNLRKIAARASIKAVVESDMTVMCQLLEEAILVAVRCDTCAHRFVNAYDAVMRSHFHVPGHRW
ncbi:hypothetical protein IAU59_003313 [Kwoniella sp. CBS 9459]